MNDLQILPRLLAPVVEQALESSPVVVIVGARQTGKTTLVQNLPSSRGRAFRTLDDLRVLDLARREPDLLVREADHVTIDEVQRVPDLLRAVKRAVDQDRRPGRFLLTGSANLLLMSAVSESLAGRAVYLHLGPLTQAEKQGRPTPWSDLLAAEDLDEARAILERRDSATTSWQLAAIEGGYPPVLTLRAEARPRWFEGYVATYLERDLQQVAEITALAEFRRLLGIAALRTGGLLNRADVARDAGLSRPTAHRYINLLEVSFQLRLLAPHAGNRTKRLVKSPKLYWTDSGLAAHLAGVEDAREDPLGPALLENLLLCQLDAWREAVTPRPEILFWRTSDGQEIDLIIEHRRRLLPIEVKSGTRVRDVDLRAMRTFLGEHRSARFGLVAFGGTEVHAVTPDILAVPVGRLL